jgi:predicted alpha/beta-fold hydrolase
MKIKHRGVFVSLVAGLLLAYPASADLSIPYEGVPNVEEVEITASDGDTLFADLVLTEKDKTAPLVILFHQAGGSARGEYRTIAPRLIEEGYHVLATDQRSGSDQFGAPNRTVDRAGTSTSYCEAYPDLIGTVAHAKAAGFAGPIFVWGSSYSAGLVINLGVEHRQGITGILSFSTAASGPMQPCSSNAFVDQLIIPTLALRPLSEMARESSQTQQEKFKSLGFETYVSDNGVHGSSMLSPWRIESSPEPTWEIVLEFLARHSAEQTAD